MKYKNITLIGTSHIAKQSINDVKQAIESGKPDIVAVELDPNRYYSLKQKKQKREKPRLKEILEIGVFGFVFSIFGRWAQERLGKMVGVMPGSEMLAAIKSARKAGSQLRLVDQDIGITLKRLSKAITFREVMRFFYDMLKSLFFGKREMQRLGIKEIDLTKVPDKKLIHKLLMEFRKHYPNTYRVLVEERNKVMARRLAVIMDQNKDKKIIAVIGAGHEKEMLDLIKHYEKQDMVTYSLSVNYQ